MAIVNMDDPDWQETQVSDAHFLRKNLARAAGAERLGCSLYEIPPGGRDWAYHYHHGNEEAIVVLRGEGILQSPNGDVPLKTGDYIALPAGPEHTHRVHNRSDGPFRFLCLSTMDDPDVVEYPETGRLGVFCGSAPGGPPEKRTRSDFYRRDENVGYWE